METPDQAASQVTTMNSDRGMITFVPISAGETGADDLAAIQGKQEYVDFQQKDEAGNIVYAWEFLGTDIKNVFDMDLVSRPAQSRLKAAAFLTDSRRSTCPSPMTVNFRERRACS